MAAVTVKQFDILEFVNKAKASGINSEFAEYQGRQIELLAEIIQEQKIELDVIKAKDPATEKDLEIVKLELQKEIEQAKAALIKWIIGTGISGVVLLSGIMLTLFKLMIH